MGWVVGWKIHRTRPLPSPASGQRWVALRCKEITRRLEGWLAYPLPAKRTRARDLLRDRQVTRLSLLSIRMVAGYSEGVGSEKTGRGERI